MPHSCMRLIKCPVLRVWPAVYLQICESVAHRPNPYVSHRNATMFKNSTSNRLTVGHSHSLSYVCSKHRTYTHICQSLSAANRAHIFGTMRQGEIRYDSVGQFWDTIFIGIFIEWETVYHCSVASYLLLLCKFE